MILKAKIGFISLNRLSSAYPVQGQQPSGIIPAGYLTALLCRVGGIGWLPGTPPA